MKIQHSEPYAPLRRQAYPPIGDQLDAVMKLASSLRDQGIDLPKEVQAWIDQCELVKATYQKK